MVCCGCAPLAVSTIYQKIDELAQKGVVCPYACATAKGRILKRARDAHALRLIETALALCRCRQNPAAPEEAATALA
jgi:hypothetical protein